MGWSLTDVGNRYMELCDLAPQDPLAFEELMGMFTEDVQTTLLHVSAPEKKMTGRAELAAMYRFFFESGPRFKHLWNVNELSGNSIEMPYVFVLRQSDGSLSVSGGADRFVFAPDGRIAELTNEQKFFIHL
ncbi:hypothetical protein [Streptomyces sp. NBC_00887]|uniref:hypothetical protein n=1 Tax=Streptomyces sp. NBC_00887 TaxID=2975859 RepID=UPI00386EA948|nr:nuclear transport factor 2 family protein [Streptomyces sp. NBC_00887]WSY36265.1 nuclear transport factor 2 family protein [Streptomyces sp. NBC_00887]